MDSERTDTARSLIELSARPSLNKPRGIQPRPLILADFVNASPSISKKHVAEEHLTASIGKRHRVHLDQVEVKSTDFRQFTTKGHHLDPAVITEEVLEKVISRYET